ncbi:uncharacterized protein LOC135097640 [Scylla paramamosain]|uniref:uncharacterized protein LOC135097640 n=1 Tax=Scylla paramamosain TaxID=85552 RepID=UPI003083041D
MSNHCAAYFLFTNSPYPRMKLCGCVCVCVAKSCWLSSSFLAPSRRPRPAMNSALSRCSDKKQLAKIIMAEVRLSFEERTCHKVLLEARKCQKCKDNSQDTLTGIHQGDAPLLASQLIPNGLETLSQRDAAQPAASVAAYLVWCACVSHCVPPHRLSGGQDNQDWPSPP